GSHGHGTLAGTAAGRGAAGDVRAVRRARIVRLATVHASQSGGRARGSSSPRDAAGTPGVTRYRDAPGRALRPGFAGRRLCRAEPDGLLVALALGRWTGGARAGVSRHWAPAGRLVPRRGETGRPVRPHQHDGVHAPAQQPALDVGPRRSLATLGDRALLARHALSQMDVRSEEH